MAERLKVFVNKTLTAADLVGNDTLPLVQTDTTTQAVVRDIEVDTAQSNITANVYLDNNGYKLTDSAVSVTGSEIVDTNSTLAYKLNPPLGPINEVVYKGCVFTYDGTNTHFTFEKTVIERTAPYNSLITPPQPVEIVTTSDPASAGSLYQAALSQDGGTLFCIWRNGSAWISYAAPVSGNKVTFSGNDYVDGIGSGFFPAAIDYATRQHVYSNNSTLYFTNVDTGAKSSFYTGYGAGSSSIMSADSGVVVCQYQYNTTTVWVHNSSNSTHQPLSFINNSSEQSKLVVTVDTTSNIAWVYIGTSTGHSVWRVPLANMSAATETLRVTSPSPYAISTLVPLGAGKFSAMRFDSGLQKYVWVEVDLTSGSPVETKVMQDIAGITPYTAGGSFMKLESSTPLPITAYDIKLKTKVSGVEITGV